MSAVKLSLSILIWTSLTLCLFVTLSKIINDLNMTVKSCLTRLSTGILSILEEELPKGGWIKVKVTIRESLFPLKTLSVLSPECEYMIFKDGDTLVIKED